MAVSGISTGLVIIMSNRKREQYFGQKSYQGMSPGIKEIKPILNNWVGK